MPLSLNFSRSLERPGFVWGQPPCSHKKAGPLVNVSLKIMAGVYLGQEKETLLSPSNLGHKWQRKPGTLCPSEVLLANCAACRRVWVLVRVSHQASLLFVPDLSGPPGRTEAPEEAGGSEDWHTAQRRS